MCDSSFPQGKRLQTKNSSFNSSLWYEPEKKVQRSETSLSICPRCKAKANDDGMMVLGWNLGGRALATHSQSSCGSMSHPAAYHFCTARLLSYRSGTQVRAMINVATSILSCMEAGGPHQELQCVTAPFGFCSR